MANSQHVNANPPRPPALPGLTGLAAWVLKQGAMDLRVLATETAGLLQLYERGHRVRLKKLTADELKAVELYMDDNPWLDTLCEIVGLDSVAVANAMRPMTAIVIQRMRLAQGRPLRADLAAQYREWMRSVTRVTRKTRRKAQVKGV